MSVDDARGQMATNWVSREMLELVAKTTNGEVNKKGHSDLRGYDPMALCG